MARVITSIKNAFDEFFNGYDPGKHYMRGPGPKWHQKHSSLQQTQDGGSFPRVVAPSDTAKVAPDTRLTQLS